MTFEERLVAVEAALKANKIPATIAELQRKLEATWQPDAGVLLEPGSITAVLMGGVVDTDGKGIKFGDLAMRWGTVSLTFTASATSATNTAAHGLPRAPASSRVFFNNVDVNIDNVALTAADATSITVQARYASAVTGTAVIGWLAIG